MLSKPLEDMLLADQMIQKIEKEVLNWYLHGASTLSGVSIVETESRYHCTHVVIAGECVPLDILSKHRPNYAVSVDDYR